MNKTSTPILSSLAALASLAALPAQVPSTQELTALKTRLERTLGTLGIARDGASGVRIGEIRAARENGKTVLRAPIRWIAPNASLEARLDGKQPERITVDFAGATIEPTRLAAGLLSGLPKSLPLPGGVVLRDLRLDRSGEAWTKATLRLAPVRKAWELPASTRLAAPKLELRLLHPTDAKKRQALGTLRGTLELGHSLRLEAESLLTKDPAKFAITASTTKPLSLSSLAHALGGPAAQKTFAPLPAAIRNSQLQNARLRVHPRTKRVGVHADCALGGIDLVAKNGKGLFVCIAPKPGFRFAQLDPALASLDKVDFDLSKMGFTISTFDGDVGDALAHVGRGIRGRVRSGLQSRERRST